ncbi:MAG: hypothetical protein H0U92_12425, partial [Actinobacteria bacterium]|nr:hypothetical protein [Actinomycetota bacterium]
PGRWQQLVDDVVAAGENRVVVSSEYFCEADDSVARRIAHGLGGPRLHVVVTLRPLTKILPSAWQQYVRNGLRTSYDDWLEGMLLRPPYDRPTATFWRRHHHDVLVDRWSSTVGPEGLTVVVVDEADRLMLMRTFEALLGLPAGLLEPEHGRANRSSSYGEAELIRALNKEFKVRDWDADAYKTYVRPMQLHLQTERKPEPGELTIHTPRWAVERAADIGAAAQQKIAASGVRIVGDLSQLGARPAETSEATVEPMLSPEAAAAAVIGAILAGQSETEKQVTAVHHEPTRLLARRLADRVLKKARLR